MSRSPTRVEAEVVYPDSDGKPMGETGIHVNATLDVFATLKWTVFRDRPDVYVAADMFFYYEQGNPKAVKAPDVMVIKGVAHSDERRTFKLWVERVAPAVIFEVTSKKTKLDDIVVKRDLYASLGVAEYFLFDPLDEYLDPPFQGFRLEDGQYRPLPRDDQGRITSAEIDVLIRPDPLSLRLLDPRTHQPIPSIFGRDPVPGEDALRIEALNKALIREKMQSEVREKKIERAQKKAKAERQKAEAEKLRADALEAELNRLRGLLGEE